jgi:penicillin-binding protein 2
LAGQHFNCGGGVSYGDHFFHCWIGAKGGSHGTLGVSDAIKVSCNSFFYQFGNAAGIEAIDETGESLGLGQTSGMEITNESPGVLPGPDWMRIHYPRERWSSAYTANVSIGQGYDLVTPLQLAMVYATVANGGVSYYPKLVQSVTDFDGKPLLNEKGTPVVSSAPKIRRDLRFDFKREQIELARRGLWKVVNEDGGTGGKARLSGVQVAGKTGTAQAMTEGKKDTIAWFACFAPYDEPKYAIAVMVQGGEHGGSVAAPIATRILSRALAMDEGTFDPQLAWLAPAHRANPFQMIAAVDFKDSNPKLTASDEENLDGSTNSDMANAGADPDVEPEADANGRVAGQKRMVRPTPAPTPPPRKPNFFERLFGVRPKPAPPPPPPPVRRTPGRR